MTDFLNHAAELASAGGDKPLPVEKWHPEHCGEMDLTIRADGSWIHEGTPIGRPALVRLFSRILRKDPDGYVLVTPAEKISITVEDVPFIIVDIERRDGELYVKSNVGDEVTINNEHPLSIRPGPGGTEVPYVLIRGGLDARFSRSAYYRLVEMATMKEDQLFVESGGEAWTLGRAV